MNPQVLSDSTDEAVSFKLKQFIETGGKCYRKMFMHCRSSVCLPPLREADSLSILLVQTPGAKQSDGLGVNELYEICKEHDVRKQEARTE